MRNSVSSSSLAEEEGEVLFCIPDVQIFHISAAVRNQIVLSGQFFPFKQLLPCVASSRGSEVRLHLCITKQAQFFAFRLQHFGFTNLIFGYVKPPK